MVWWRSVCVCLQPPELSGGGSVDQDGVQAQRREEGHALLPDTMTELSETSLQSSCGGDCVRSHIMLPTVRSPIRASRPPASPYLTLWRLTVWPASVSLLWR